MRGVSAGEACWATTDRQQKLAILPEQHRREPRTLGDVAANHDRKYSSK